MSIRKVTTPNGDKFELQEYWPDGSCHKRRYDDKKTAEQVEALIRAGKALGTWAETKRKLAIGFKDSWTLDEFYTERYLPEIQARKRSWERDETSWRCLSRMLAKDPLEGFQTARLAVYVQTRLAEQSQKGENTVEPATVNREIAFLKAMFSFAVRTGVIRENPLTRFRLLRVQQKELEIPSITEYRAKADSIQSLVLRALVTVAGECGLRRSELMQLERRHVSLAERSLTVTGITKSYKVRRVPLSSRAIEALSAIVQRVDQPKVFFPYVEQNKLVRVMRRHGIRLHSLRHMRCTQWLSNGVPAPVVQRWMGHANIQTTLRYFHFLPDAAGEAFARSERIENERLQMTEAING